MQLKDGDIIMLGRNQAVDAVNADHYAVVENGKIYEVVNLPQGGEARGYDVKKAGELFRKSRISSADLKTYTSPSSFKHFSIYRK